MNVETVGNCANVVIGINFFFFGFSRFDLVRKLGQGTYGKVQLGINKETGQEVPIE